MRRLFFIGLCRPASSAIQWFHSCSASSGSIVTLSLRSSRQACDAVVRRLSVSTRPHHAVAFACPNMSRGKGALTNKAATLLEGGLHPGRVIAAVHLLELEHASPEPLGILSSSGNGQGGPTEFSGLAHHVVVLPVKWRPPAGARLVVARVAPGVVGVHVGRRGRAQLGRRVERARRDGVFIVAK